MKRLENLRQQESFYDPDYISIDPDAISYIEFEDYFQHHGNERCWRVIYGGKIQTESTRVKGQIGSLYIRTDGYTFEDNLQVERDGKYQETDPRYHCSRCFIPFANQPWQYTFTEDNPTMDITPRMKDFVKSHYNKCNKFSVEAQKVLNYNENLHRKFAAMDNILNSFSTKSEMYGSSVSLWTFYSDNDLVNATVILLNNGLIKQGIREIFGGESSERYHITDLGKRADSYGYNEAQKFNIERDRENELLEIGQKTIEAQESIKKSAQNMEITSKKTGKYASMQLISSIVIGVPMLILTIFMAWQQYSQISAKTFDDTNELSAEEVFEFMKYKQETEQMFRFFPSIR